VHATERARNGILERVTPDPERGASVRKTPFTVPRAGEDVPAILWLPDRPAERRPLVLLGHGGGMHKQSPFIDRLGNWLAGGSGFACLAIDLPVHGERTPPDEVGLSIRERRSRLGLAAWRERNAGATEQAVGDWRAAIDASRDVDPVPHGPIGYFGLSMGTRFGVPLIAAEPRISAAVLGLFGVPAADTESAFARAARQVTIPVLFLQQWDDELFPREDCLALFDLLASEDKTLHASPGGHLGVPRAELGGAAHFLRRRLGGGGNGRGGVGGGDPGSPVGLLAFVITSAGSLRPARRDELA
jgi:dienelactone hydrolase